MIWIVPRYCWETRRPQTWPGLGKCSEGIWKGPLLSPLSKLQTLYRKEVVWVVNDLNEGWRHVLTHKKSFLQKYERRLKTPIVLLDSVHIKQSVCLLAHWVTRAWNTLIRSGSLSRDHGVGWRKIKIQNHKTERRMETSNQFQIMLIKLFYQNVLKNPISKHIPDKR